MIKINVSYPHCCDSSTNISSLRLEEFIAPMIKATQELNAKNIALEAKVEF